MHQDATEDTLHLPLVDRVAATPKLSDHFGFPDPGWIQVDVHHTADVVWCLDITLFESAHVLPAKFAHQVSVLEHYILTRSIFWRGIALAHPAPQVAGRIQRQCEVGIIRVVLNLLDNRFSAASLLMQHYRLKTQRLDETAHLLLRLIVSTVDDENVALVSGNWDGWAMHKIPPGMAYATRKDARIAGLRSGGRSWQCHSTWEL